MNIMPEQLTLPGLIAEQTGSSSAIASRRRGRPLRYTVFLAIFPSVDDADRIARVAAELRARQGLLAHALSADRLHMTLHTVATFQDAISQAVIDAAVAAAAVVRCASFTVELNRALTFEASGAYVLRCTAPSDARIAELRGLLARPLRQNGLRPVPSGTPHMTMLYATQRIAEHPVTPIPWTATRFALIVSHVGRHHHEWIGQWNLPAEP